MNFVTFADGTSNLPGRLLGGIRLLPCAYTIDGVQATYDGNLDAFDARAYYDRLRNGSVVKTSLLNTQLFLEAFRPVLQAGKDVIYIAMSSGISGTFQAARIAAAELMEDFKGRLVHIVDSRTCGLGTGMLAVLSSELDSKDVPAKEAAAILDEEVEHCCSYFTVDDLNFLKKTGRVSGATAMIGTALQIKPILLGSSEGNIIACAKVRGRKRSIEALAEKYREKAVDPDTRRVYISHGDCRDDAEYLAKLLREIKAPKELVICQHEPFSGSHVGPGMLGLFFHGRER
jgi:DegV family protein with EDD domain